MASEIVVPFSDSQLWLRLAARHLRDDRLIEAAGAAWLALAAAPNDERAWHCRGVVAARRFDFELAVICFQEVVARNPDNIEAWVNLAESCLAQLDYQRAADGLRQALALDPDALTPAGRRARGVIARTSRALDMA